MCGSCTPPKDSHKVGFFGQELLQGRVFPVVPRKMKVARRPLTPVGLHGCMSDAESEMEDHDARERSTGLVDYMGSSLK